VGLFFDTRKFVIMVTTVGPFWEKKMLSFARRINVKGDKQLCKQDFEAIAERYNALAKPPEVKAKQITRKTVKLWTDYFGKDATNDKIDETKFLAAMKTRKDTLFQVALLFFDMWFDVVDQTAVGVIDKDQYALFLKTLMRIEDKAAAYESFKKIDLDGDGKVGYDEFVQFAVGYFITNDESGPTGSLLGPLI